MMDFSAQPASAATVTVIAGDSDDYVDATDLRRWAENTAPRATVEIIAGASHFFAGAHPELSAAAERAFTRR